MKALLYTALCLILMLVFKNSWVAYVFASIAVIIITVTLLKTVKFTVKGIKS